MFFSQTESFEIKRYIKEQWVSLSQFYDKLSVNEPLFLKGYGFLQKEEQGQFTENLGYYILTINDRIFAFCGESLNGQTEEGSILSFKYIIEFNESILNSSLFEPSAHTGSKNHFTKFDAELTVDAKIYLYEDEEKLLITKNGKGNIDLYCSYQIINQSNNLICKVYPAAFAAAKQLALNKVLEQRIKNLKK
jgi:hypothetical protein